MERLDDIQDRIQYKRQDEKSELQFYEKVLRIYIYIYNIYTLYIWDALGNCARQVSIKETKDKRKI